MTPARNGYTLTESAQQAFEEWQDEYSGRGCLCHLSAPCSHCIHPGNPENLQADDGSWEIGEYATGAIVEDDLIGGEA